MKKFIIGINLVLLLSISGAAQKSKADPETISDRQSTKKQSNRKSEQNGGLLLQSGTNIEAQLQQTLDVSKAQVGDEVVLATTKAIKQNGQTVVQKGARLVGRVTEVQQKSKSSGQSKLGVVFERLEGKNLNAPISATIVSISQAAANASVGDTLDSDLSGSSTSSGSVSRSGSGGGLLGGVSNTVGGVINTTANTVGTATNTAGQTLGGANQTLGRTLGGIQLSQSSSASASGATTLSTPNKNLRLEKGVTFQLRLTESIEN